MGGVLTAGVWADEVSDKDITNHIETEFWTDPAVPSNAITVKTQDGIVTFHGSVDNLLAKERALKTAAATVGVRAVVNRLEVRPPVAQPDRDIQQDIEQALLTDPATEAYEVQTAVRDGHVKLTGKVQSWQEKQLCATVAKGVKGVVGVSNDITVNYKKDRPDYEIKTEVQQRLANDVRVDDALIQVDVKDEKVTLSGTVGSLQEKTQAGTLAWVGGVDSVNTDGLEIEWWARDDLQRKHLYVSRSEEEIENAVQDAFLYDPRVLSFKIDADADGATVILTGVVNNLKAKQAAEQDAKNTTGVLLVKNNIKVRPKVIPADSDLKKSITDALLDDLYVDRFDLSVSAYSGVVYLSGNVNTSWEKQHAETVAEGVKGVLSVVNSIDYEHHWTWKPDWEIIANIEDELFWSPFVNHDEVNVSVENGIATLTGTVDTFSENRSAEDNAFEGGAKDVLNKLSVKYQNYGPYYYGPYGPYSYNN
jgi:osmotically-inducible protein OsmY